MKAPKSRKWSAWRNPASYRRSLARQAEASPRAVRREPGWAPGRPKARRTAAQPEPEPNRRRREPNRRARQPNGQGPGRNHPGWAPAHRGPERKERAPGPKARRWGPKHRKQEPTRRAPGRSHPPPRPNSARTCGSWPPQQHPASRKRPEPKEWPGAKKWPGPKK
ncbi:hypothetical protein GCM10010331_50880 [Streptomyces xanthochromogenes]|nr:hypothetical protein GCM10010331_50880 [Streptomyces xanthochromogenes]